MGSRGAYRTLESMRLPINHRSLLQVGEGKSQGGLFKVKKHNASIMAASNIKLLILLLRYLSPPMHLSLDIFLLNISFTSDNFNLNFHSEKRDKGRRSRYNDAVSLPGDGKGRFKVILRGSGSSTWFCYFSSRLLTIPRAYTTFREVITGFAATLRNPNSNISLLYYRMLAGKNICRLVANTLDPTYMISIVSQKNCDSCWLEEVTSNSPIGSMRGDASTILSCTQLMLKGRAITTNA
ncbi:hypothetical protein J3E68DRAFT_234332 [Trichoderma sp. SZMC 28012]